MKISNIQRKYQMNNSRNNSSQDMKELHRRETLTIWII